MIIDHEVKKLVSEIESLDPSDVQGFNLTLQKLIHILDANCRKPEVRKRYVAYQNTEVPISAYPIDSEGYAISFDPIEDEEGFWNAWNQFGIIVGKQVVSSELCERAVMRMRELVLALSNDQCDLNDPITWQYAPTDANGVSLISRGFFEVYHDAILADLRQSIRLYIHHVVIWGRVDLWTSFDRLGVKLPSHEESYALPLHVDQNPLIHPHFKTIQGGLALVDCPVERLQGFQDHAVCLRSIRNARPIMASM